MKRLLFLGGLLGLVLLLGACGGTPQENSAYHKITAEEAKEQMDEGGVTVVDVRTPEEYASGHIQGAVNLPNETIGEEAPKALEDKQAVVLLYCRTGVRSKNAAQKLVELGYENVYDFGGIVDWTYGTVAEE